MRSLYLSLIYGNADGDVSPTQVNRVYRVTQELHNAPRGSAAGASLGPERMEVQARKFYSQRNMYLCGFTLFLSLILNRTYVLILDILRLEEAVKALREESNLRTEERKKGEESRGEVEKLKLELERKEMDLQTMKKQTQGLTTEYGILSDKYESTQRRAGEVRKDI